MNRNGSDSEGRRALRHRASAPSAPALPLEARLQAGLEHAEVGTAFFDPDLRYLYINPYAAALTGHTPAALLGRGLEEVVAAEFGTDTAREVVAHFRRTLATGESYSVRTWGASARTHGGEVRSSDWTVRRAADAQGKVTGVVLTVSDVSEQTRAEREWRRLLESEQQLRYATEAVAGLFTIAEVIHEITERAREATGADGAFVERLDPERGDLEVAAAVGRWVPAVGTRLPFPDSLAERVMERAKPLCISNLSQAQIGLSPHLLQPCANCSVLVVHLTDAGGAIGALILLRATARGPFRSDQIDRAGTFASLAALGFRKIHLLQEAERQRDELQEVMVSRERLIHGFSHDLRNPLGGALLHLQLLYAQLSGIQAQMVERIETSIQRAVKLADDMLQLAVAEAGKLRIEPGAVNLRAAAREVVEEYRARAEQKGLQIFLDVPPVLPVIESDWSRVHQILGNLAENAVRYTESGRITLSVEISEEEEKEEAPGPGRWIHVAVSDNGPGIPEDQRERVFEEFTRLAPGQAAGAGLGLAISRRIARALGGEITLESQVGRGSTFTLRLPYRPVAG